MKPALVIMAAGMGSRYGGLKQIDPIGPNGEIIIDYSLYDAKRAGFEDVYCIIRHDIEADFKEIMERGAAKHLNIHYAFQDITDLPDGYSVPDGREKPWGTSHAVLAVRDMVKQPFAVINADDYYGPEGFKQLYDFLSKADNDKNEFCMVGYNVENTLTENGSVARGVCERDANDNLTHIVERLKIQINDGRIQFTEDDGASWTDIPVGTTVSMNMFGFTAGVIKELRDRENANLDRIIKENPLKGEYLLPTTVCDMIDESIASVKILPSLDKWFGVTYKEDKPVVVSAMKEKVANGIYPEKLWQ